MKKSQQLTVHSRQLGLVYSLLVALILFFTTGTKCQVIQINQSFSSDTILKPFSGSAPVYSLSMSGGVNLYSDSSLVRVVLIDTYGNHCLVFESYPLITTENMFDTLAACDETCFLDGVICDSLRIDIISAFLDLDSLKLDTNYIPNIPDMQSQAKWFRDSVKIAIMNQRIVEEQMYWRAGRTVLNELSHQEREIQFGSRYNLRGYDFYKGGLYKIIGHRPYNPSQTVFVTDFDWRNRHRSDYSESPYYNFESPTGVNGYPLGWISPFQCPQQGNTCYAFAAIYFAETLANLYFNNCVIPGSNPNPCKHQINLDLSQEQIIVCQNLATSCTIPGTPAAYLYSYMCNHFIVNEECFPFQCPPPQIPPIPCPTCSSPTDEIKLGGTASLSIMDQDYLKEKLINFGPLSLNVLNYVPGTSLSHQMLLVGYSYESVGDTVYYGTGAEDPPIVLDENYENNLTIHWWFKDSYQNKFFPIEGDITNSLNSQYIVAGESRYLTGPIYRDLIETPIICSDEDGDGYYWWGIHWKYENQQVVQVNPQECNCPPGVKINEEDCNDWDPTAGPYATNENNPYSQNLYSCIPNECVTIVEPYPVNDNETWTLAEGDRHINQNVIIHEGATLTIQCQVFFTPGAKIIVEPGGVLILQGTMPGNEIIPARLSSGCGSFWSGIEIWGDPGRPQEEQYQGKVIIEGGIIENAVCGIMTGDSNYMPEGGGQGEPYPVYPSGGIIEATLATFKNNKTGIEFYPYRYSDLPNLSFFRGCDFYTNTELLNSATPEYFIKLDGVNKVDILGCTFKNTRQATPPNPPIPYSVRGRGILSSNSAVYLNDTLQFPLIFENLEYGICGLHSGLGTAWINLHEADLINNKSGVYLSGFQEMNPVAIYSNNFSQAYNFDSDEQYGLYLDQCSGYEIQLNAFTGNFTAGGVQYGIIVNNSGARTNYIYDNDFNNLHSALQGQNVNRGYYLPDLGVPLPEPEPETGLCFKCNNFHNCINDIIVTDQEIDPDPESGITLNQGCDKGATSPTAQKEPAGNTFSSLDPPTDHVYDVDMDASVNNIIYIHHHYIQDYRVIPDKDYHVHNPEKVTLKEHRSAYAVYNPTSSCPDFEYPTDNLDSLKAMFTESKSMTDSLIALLVQIIDEGSTEGKNEMVQTSVPNQSSEVYLDLMGFSPYLSDTVLRSSAEKEDVLTNAMITDIMVANPQSAKNENVLEALDERFFPLSDSMWMEIFKGVDSIAGREQIEAELSGWIQLKEKLFDEICEYYLMDTLNQVAPDSLLLFMKNDHTFSTRLLLANLYIDRKMFSSADSLLESIPEYYTISPGDDSTRQRFQELIPILSELFVDTVGNLVPDSVRQLELMALSESQDIPGVYARNILIANNLLEYREPIFSTASLKTVRRYHSGSTGENTSNNAYKVYPNPCYDYLTVESIHQALNPNIEVTIFNNTNQLVSVQRFPAKRNVMILSFREQAEGVYFIRIVQNGLPAEIHKIIHLD